eukprot:6194391-Pleurochrysis_carterae.AAC.1
MGLYVPSQDNGHSANHYPSQNCHFESGILTHTCTFIDRTKLRSCNNFRQRKLNTYPHCGHVTHVRSLPTACGGGASAHDRERACSSVGWGDVGLVSRAQQGGQGGKSRGGSDAHAKWIYPTGRGGVGGANLGWVEKEVYSDCRRAGFGSVHGGTGSGQAARHAGGRLRRRPAYRSGGQRLY